jgi:hypothetical protein
VRIDVTDADYWEASDIKLVVLLKYAAASLTNGKVPVGDSGHIAGYRGHLFAAAGKAPCAGNEGPPDVALQSPLIAHRGSATKNLFDSQRLDAIRILEFVGSP